MNSDSTSPLPATSPTISTPQSADLLSTLALICSLLFIAGVVFAGLIHPDIPLSIVGLIVAFPVAALVLGSLARRRGRNSSRPVQARAAFILGGIELGLIAIVAMMLPLLCRAREPANRVKCSSNLRQIGMALNAYAIRNDGQFPPTLDALLADPQSEITAGVFVCPSSGNELAPGETAKAQVAYFRANPQFDSYVYAGARLTTVTAAPHCILVYEHPANHKKAGMNILFGDGHVEFLAREESERVIAELSAGHNPPRPSLHR